MGNRREHNPACYHLALLASVGLLATACGAVEEDMTMATAATTAPPTTLGETSDGSDSSMDDESADESGGDTEDSNASDSDPSDTEGPETTGADTDDPDSGTVEGVCDFDMDVAVKLTMNVDWMGGLAILEGAGQIDAYILGDLTPEGDKIRMTGTMCSLALPDFDTGLLAGNETYGTQFPVEVWTNPAMPKINALASVSSADPGATLLLERGAVVLGGTMADPLNDPWPATWEGVTAVDHDGDGSPGITAMAKTGAPYAYPRIDILNTDARAEGLYIVSRTIMAFDGTISDCDHAGGNATVTMENHAVGCDTVGGGNCATAQTGTLDGAMPQFNVTSSSFELVRMPTGATCADVLTELQ